MTDVEPVRRWRPGQVAAAVPDGGSAAWLRAAERAVGRFVVRRYALCASLVMALMALNVFVGLAGNSVNDSDEARYGVSAYEMLQNRSYIVTTYGDQPEYWNLKPPLGYWLIALSYRLFGFSALAMRLPSVVCGLLVVLLTMAFAKRWANRRIAILAGLIVATAFGFLSHHGARSADLDAQLTLLLLAVALQLPRLADSPYRIALLGLLFGCGFLLKSFAVFPMLLVAAVYLVASGAWRRQRVVALVLALALATLPVAAWAYARYQADGSAYFLERMVREDLVARSTTIIDKGDYSLFGYVGALFDRFAPWPVLIVLAALLAWRTAGFRLAPLWRRHRHSALPLLFLWTAIPLALFSVSRTQHHWYLDPIYPACAMLAAAAALYLVRRAGTGARRSFALLGLLVLPLAFCQLRVLDRVLGKERMPESQRFLASLKRQHPRPCGEVQAGFPLRYSERFLLEVIDGFHVTEPGLNEMGGTPADGACLLVSRSRRVLSAQPGPDGLMLAVDGSYALFATGRDALAQARQEGGLAAEKPAAEPAAVDF